MTKPDDHYMHLLQSIASVREASTRREIEAKLITFLDNEAASVDFSAVEEEAVASEETE